MGWARKRGTAKARATSASGRGKPGEFMRNKVAVTGVGNTTFGKLPGNSPYDLGIWALKEALADAGLSKNDLDGVIVNRIPDYQRFCELMGINPRFALVTPGQGRMSGNSIQIAALAIANGVANTIA